MALLTVAALLGLGVDRAPTQALTSYQLGTGSYWIWSVALIAVPVVVLLARSLGVLNTAARVGAKKT
jgi:hypothetical protein